MATRDARFPGPIVLEVEFLFREYRLREELKLVLAVFSGHQLRLSYIFGASVEIGGIKMLSEP
jgi:hypothetical protein